ncbi:MAG: SAM-dependent methyltransferase [Nitrospiraceae bacterium]
MISGNSQLIAAIVEEIQRSGPITFARFMELALYHPRFGYYMHFGTEAGREENGTERIGWGGDYYTSSDVHPIFARSLVKQACQVDALLSHPDPFTVVEMGAGKGLFARDFLAECAASSESFFRRLRYVILERSPAMRGVQRKNLTPWLESDHLSWTSGLGDLGSNSIVGVMLSNELVDAFPVHRIRIDRGQPKEIFVAYENARFHEILQELSTHELEQYLDRLHLFGISLPEGYTTEINLDALTWIKEVARVLQRGLVVTIDYGHTAPGLYDPARHSGTLLCYYRHAVSENPYTRIGWQDMTSHVDFTSLAAIGEEAGLRVTGFTNQMSFLMGWGIEETVGSLDPESDEFRSIIRLLRPEGMGRTFKLLMQHKGMKNPELDGLRFKPFFSSALAVTSVIR